MYEYIGNCKERNQNVEMAYHSVSLYDWVGVFAELGYLWTIQLKNSREGGKTLYFFCLIEFTDNIEIIFFKTA